MKDIIFLVADKDAEFLLRGLLPRLPITQGIENFSYDIKTHVNHDPACKNESSEFLRPFISQYRFAIVIFDYEGCGQSSKSSESIENEVSEKLSKNGWNERNSVIVIKPELENWIWVSSPSLAKAIDWKPNDLQEWLNINHNISSSNLKPQKPKEVFDKALRIAKVPHSSSIFEEVAANASFKNCVDVSFQKMIKQLTIWFSTKKNPTN